jgi:antitoxin MazE
MLVSIVRIGNSRGVRLPKAILDQLKISEKVDLEVEDQQIVLKPIQSKPRTGWSNAFKRMAEMKEDTLFIQENSITEGFEWEW